ncbi:MAG: hypothetical protein A3F72_02215 [Bacteroidetes bacterium RIFCSPLOWO2_12_FULL_35_15]|nr:MAG: hypothetical protein A3F72_02215 [Bacteroidetes bacterium RIFCSPLOWO2_12_FULL_35_15]
MKKTITLSLASLVALGLMSFGVLNNNGKAGKTTTGCSCHGSAATANVNVSLSFNPAMGNSYVPNTTYTVTATVAYTGETNAGIDLAASAGTLTAGTNTKILTNEIVQTGTGNTTTTGSVDFNFTWTAPASGSVTFNYCGLAANSNSGTSGDFWNLGTKTVTLSAVGIAEQKATNINLSVFPNPVSESANISYELGANSTVSATLINVTGQVVTTFFNKEEQTAGKQNRKLMMEPSIAKGIYFVAINVNGKNSYKKIVVE